MNYTNLISAIFEYGSVVMAAMVLLVFATTITVEVVKGLFKKVPTNIVAFIVSMIVTILAVIILCAVLRIPFVWYYIVGAILLGIFVAYASMYGFDKFKETWVRFKAYNGK
jgi:hypothetical protein